MLRLIICLSALILFFVATSAMAAQCENYTGTFEDVGQPLVMKQVGCDKITLVTRSNGDASNEFDIIPGKTTELFQVGDKLIEYRWLWSGPHLAIQRTTSAQGGKILEKLNLVHSLDRAGDLDVVLTYTDYAADGSSRVTNGSAHHRRLN